MWSVVGFGWVAANRKPGVTGCGVIFECFKLDVEIAVAPLCSHWVEVELRSISLLWMFCEKCRDYGLVK